MAAGLPSGGRVTVSTARRDSEGLIRVADNGRGMDAEAREQMLVAFKTGDKRRGSGIGLPTVVDIVERHGGRLEIDSALGKGSTFTIALPLAE